MEKPKLLIVDDDEGIRSQMKWALADIYDVHLAEDRLNALAAVNAKRPPLILLDLGLPPNPRGAEEGLRCLKELLRIDPGTKVIVVTGNQEKGNALTAIEQGAFDYFLKPADIEELKVVLKRAWNIFQIERENLEVQEKSFGDSFEEIIGGCPQMQRVFAMIRKVAKTDAPVLIEGESGTGKELIARAIHRSGENFQEKAFVAINCGAIPENLLESELFGHEKGSFTGADAQKKGKIEYAAGGTLFLDEVGELPLLLQVKLLRFLQERQVERVGGRAPIPVTARVIAATNRELKREIEEGRFREDLYYRLGVVNMVAPPLRERGEDIVVLANNFLKKFAGQYRKAVHGFRSDAMIAIRSYAWPGNVRELENKVKRAVIMSEKRSLTPKDLDLSPPEEQVHNHTLKDVRSAAEREHILKVLGKWDWNITKAAKEMEISRPTLHDLIKKYMISKGSC
jgi:two-component system, NtrC family, response regulator